MDIEKELYPNARDLQTDDVNGASAIILDAELDPIHCTFNNDSCVEIDVSDLSYITLTLENLATLERLIGESEEFYNK